MHGAKLILNGEVIWENPEGIGHFMIKLRKQVYEERLADEIMKRKQKIKSGENVSGADNQQGRLRKGV